MSNYCVNCGSREYSGRCTNCHEELYILDQYAEQGLPYPDDSTEFMKAVKAKEKDVEHKRMIKAGL